MGDWSVNRVGYTSVKSKTHNLMLNSIKYTDFWHIIRIKSKKEKCLTK